MKKYKAVYFAAIGGAGALISKTITKADVIAYDDLGAEAIRRLEVNDFPATVINDIYGGDLYEEGKAKYKVSPDKVKIYIRPGLFPKARSAMAGLTRFEQYCNPTKVRT